MGGKEETMTEKISVSYKKLWKLLIDYDMYKKDLAKVAGISNFTITKMSKGENVNVDTLCKICVVLNCKIDDIIEFSVDQEDVG
jgi:DNA-binding Xre family transcriptional regulator